MVQAEPWLERDQAMIDQLTSVGIARGKPFQPDAATEKILDDAASEAHAGINARYETRFSPPYFAGSHWAVPASQEVIAGLATGFAESGVYPVDGRGVTFAMAYFSAKHLGSGQFCLMTINDKEGQPFDSSRSYRLTVPANAPVELYWSATVYDRATHALIRDQASNWVPTSPDG